MSDSTPMAGDTRRIEVWYTGRVQGVGFRYTARNVARRFEVAGFVQNLPDGRVWLVAEGASSELQRFLAAVAEAMQGYIRNVETVDRPATGEFSGFGVSLG